MLQSSLLDPGLPEGESGEEVKRGKRHLPPVSFSLDAVFLRHEYTPSEDQFRPNDAAGDSLSSGLQT